MAACPVSAITNNDVLGTLEIDGELCVMCEDCIAACPFKAIYRDGIDEKIIACNFCEGDPQCVRFCETRAIEFLEKDSVAVQKKKKSQQELEGLLKLLESYTGGPGS